MPATEYEEKKLQTSPEVFPRGKYGEIGGGMKLLRLFFIQIGILFFLFNIALAMPPYPPDRFKGALIVDGVYLGKVRCSLLRQMRWGENNTLSCITIKDSKKALDNLEQSIEAIKDSIERVLENIKKID